MTIYKDDSRGTWFFVVRIKQADGTTKQVKRRGFKTKKEAKIEEAKLLTSDITTNDFTFQQMTDKYLEWYEKRRKNSSVYVTNLLFKNQILPYFGKMKMKDILPKHILEFQDKIYNSYSADTLKKVHANISSVFNFAIKFYGYTSNPARITGNFDIEVNKRMNYWELEEFKKFITVVNDLTYKAFFTTLYYSGARKGELVALLWKDVNFETNEISINKTEYKKEITTPKTKSSIRTILLPSFVMKLLKELKQDQETKFPVKDSYVVFGEIHSTLASSTLEWRLKKYIKESEVKKIVLHEFRHSHASYLINKGVGPNLIAKRLGHSDVAMTLNRYAHLYPSEEFKIIELMEDDF